MKAVVFHGIGDTIGCGSCSYCRAGYRAQCDSANPNGPQAGTAFFGRPQPAGAFNQRQPGWIKFELLPAAA